MELLAKDFNTRQELEKKVASSIGLTSESKSEHTIKGTKQELKGLQLSHGKIFWGIRVEQTDLPKADANAKKKAVVRVNRGKTHKAPKQKSVDIKSSKER